MEALLSMILIVTTLNVSERGQIVGANAAIATGAMNAALPLVAG
jgi:hypothetical protein